MHGCIAAMAAFWAALCLGMTPADAAEVNHGGDLGGQGLHGQGPSAPQGNPKHPPNAGPAELSTLQGGDHNLESDGTPGYRSPGRELVREEVGQGYASMWFTDQAGKTLLAFEGGALSTGHGTPPVQGGTPPGQGGTPPWPGQAQAAQAWRGARTSQPDPDRQRPGRLGLVAAAPPLRGE